VIVESVGPVSYMVKVQDGSVHKCHIDHIHHRVDNPSVSNTSTAGHNQISEESSLVTFPIEQAPPTASAQNRTDSSSSVTPTIRRNPPRDKHPPKTLSDLTWGRCDVLLYDVMHCCMMCLYVALPWQL